MVPRTSSRARLLTGAGPATAVAVALACLAVLAASPAAATPGLGARPVNLDPFRRAVAQAEPAPAPAPAPPAAAPAPAARPVGATCQSDDQCVTGTICQQGVCTTVEPPIRALLFRKEGGSTMFIPFWFSNRGNPGHTVLAPFYWHFWSPEGKTRIVAPFFWRFADHAKQRVVTVIPPFSHTSQPDAESWAVWPLLYRSTKFGWAAPLLLSFKIASPDEGRAFGLYALLYWWKRNEREGSSFDLLIPLFASSRSAGSAFTWIAPLNFYWRSGQGDAARKSFLGLPFAYWSSDAKTGTLITPVGYHSRAGENRRGAFAWLYWFGRKKYQDGQTDNHDIVFPLVWSFRGSQSNTTIVPPLVHLRRETYSFTTLFPLYWSAYDPKAGSGWRFLLPVFFGRTREHGRQFSWLTPIGGYARDDDNGSRTLGGWVPPMIFTRNNERELDMALFLYWRHKDLRSGASTWLVGPFFRRSDNQGTTSTFFPLFWYFSDASNGAAAHSLFPLYFRRSHPTHTLTAAGVFPLWAYYRNWREGGFSAGLFPIAFFGTRPDRGHGILFPLFWHFRDRQSTATVAIPFFYRFASERSTSLGVPPLLYFYARESHLRGNTTVHDTSHVQFPLFWRFANGRTGNTTTVIPPLYWKSGATGWSAGLFPVLFAASWQTRSHFVLAPLFWHFRDKEADRTSTLVLNFLHRRHGGEVTNALYPLFYWRRGAKPGGSDETSFTLFPLVHYRRDAHTRVFVSPIAASARGPHRKAGLIPPYFWYDSKAVSVSGVPFLYLDLTRHATADRPTERTRLFGPYVAVDSPGASARVLFPLFARYHDPDEYGTWVFPTFFRRRMHDGYKVDSFLPLFWYSRSPKHATTVVGPFWRTNGENRSGAGLFPLFAYSRNAERRYLLTPLFWTSKNYVEGTGRTIAALLYYRWSRPDGHTSVGFPLYWAARTGPSRFNVLFPLLWNFANDEEGRSNTLLLPFYWSHYNHGKIRTRGLIPLGWYSRDDEKQAASHALMPLFYERHGPNERKIFTLPFGYGRTPDRRFWWALNLIRHDSVYSTFTTFFPLYFGHVDKATETSTRVIPPLLLFSRSRPDRSLRGLGLLFWRHTDISSATNLALPLFYDIHNYHQNRLTILAPLFLRYWRASDQSTFTLAPLFYRRSSPTDSTTVGFPLYWDFASQQGTTPRRSTVLFPLFAYFRRPNYVEYYVLPSIYYRRGINQDAGTSRLFIFPLWESGAKRPGDTMWEILLGLFGYERIGRNRYVKVLFFPFQLSPAPAAQTAWYGRAPTRRAHAPGRQRRTGIDTRAW